MPETRVGVRQLKEHLSEYLSQVKSGGTVVVTEHGRQVARIVPTPQPLEASLQAMAEAGQIAWSGRKLQPMPPVASARGQRTVAELLVEDRQ